MYFQKIFFALVDYKVGIVTTQFICVSPAAIVVSGTQVNKSLLYKVGLLCHVQ